MGQSTEETFDTSDYYHTPMDCSLAEVDAGCDFASTAGPNASPLCNDDAFGAGIDRTLKIFTSSAQLHYRYAVKYLPILIILVPSILSLFFPRTIKVGSFQLGNEQSNPSAIVVDMFSILTLCWMVKFLLDWPWKWYLQINGLKAKLESYLDSQYSNATDPHQEEAHGGEEWQATADNSLRQLNWQQGASLVCCVITPFICWWILVFARDKIIVMGASGATSRVVLSDLNVVIFVSCGILRVIIQISEHIQRSTASIEQRTEKWFKLATIRRHSTAQHQDQNSGEMQEIKASKRDEELSQRISRLEYQLSEVSSKIQMIYSRNKVTLDNEGTFLSMKHFKILEQEINEINYKLNNKYADLDSVIFRLKEEVVGTKQIDTNSTRALVEQSDAIESKRPGHSSSLHGIVLTKRPTYIPQGLNSSSGTLKYPVEEYAKSLKNGIPGFKSSWVQYLASTLSPKEEGSVDDNDAEHLDDLHESNLNKLTDLNGSGNKAMVQQVLWFFIDMPLFLQRLIWSMIAYIPTRLLRMVYLVALMILEVLVQITSSKSTTSSGSKEFSSMQTSKVINGVSKARRYNGLV